MDELQPTLPDHTAMAKAIREAAEAFNLAVRQTYGLDIEVVVKTTARPERPYIEVMIWKKL
jgi:hypothetical protein